MYPLGEESPVLRTERNSREMPPNRRNRSKLCSLEILHLIRAIGDTEIQIGFTWHDRCLGLNGSKRFRQVATIDFVSTDVRILPSPELSEQVIRIPLKEMILPKGHKMILNGWRTQGLVKPLSVEILARSPSGVNAGECSKSAQGRRCKPVVLPQRICGESRFQSLEKHKVMG